MLRQDCPNSNRQHNSCCLHKQGRRHEVRTTLCPSIENPDLVFQEASNCQSPTHSSPSRCGSPQAFMIRPDHSNRMVPPSRGLPENMHFSQNRKLHPSTIDGSRSAIADKMGNSPINVRKDENFTRLLDSFHRDRPRGRRGIPSWNLSLVIDQLTKAPYEASLKHVTFKTFFLFKLWVLAEAGVKATHGKGVLVAIFSFRFHVLCFLVGYWLLSLI